MISPCPSPLLALLSILASTYQIPNNGSGPAKTGACINDAAGAIQQILLAEHGDKPVRRFVALVHVDLYAESNLTPDEISDWLVKVARLTVDSEKHGIGPREGKLGLCHIDWSQRREIRTAKD